MSGIDGPGGEAEPVQQRPLGRRVDDHARARRARRRGSRPGRWPRGGAGRRHRRPPPARAGPAGRRPGGRRRSRSRAGPRRRSPAGGSPGPAPPPPRRRAPAPARRRRTTSRRPAAAVGAEHGQVPVAEAGALQAHGGDALARGAPALDRDPGGAFQRALVAEAGNGLGGGQRGRAGAGTRRAQAVSARTSGKVTGRRRSRSRLTVIAAVSAIEHPAPLQDLVAGAGVAAQQADGRRRERLDRRRIGGQMAWRGGPCAPGPGSRGAARAGLRPRPGARR